MSSSCNFNTKSAAFENAIRCGRRFDNSVLLQAYAYYKQATVGDNKTSAPSMFDLKGKAKYDAWCQLKGTSKSQAELQYMNLVTKLGL